MSGGTQPAAALDAAAGAQALRRYVNEALVGQSKGTSPQQYQELVSNVAEYRQKVFLNPADSAAAVCLASLLRGLAGSISSIRERKHDALLAEVLGVRLWGCPEVVRSAFVEVLNGLVVAHSTYIHMCLQLLVDNFMPPPMPPTPGADLGPWIATAEELSVQGSILQALSKVLSLVPTSAPLAVELIAKGRPHKLRDRRAHCLYLTAVLTAAEGRGGGPVKEALLVVAVEHVLALDVEIQWKDIVDVPTGEEDDEDEEEEEEVEEVFELEGMSELDINADPEELRRAAASAAAANRGGWEGSTTAASAAAAATAAAASGKAAEQQEVDEAASKLDSLMELTFAHVGRRCDAGELPAVWATLLSATEATLLSTHRSKFTQFLLFLVASRDPGATVPSLLQLLLRRLRNELLPPAGRAAAVAYLASFLARAAFVPPVMVLDALFQVASFCQSYAATAPIPRAASLGNVSIIGAHGMTVLAVAQAAATGFGGGATPAMGLPLSAPQDQTAKHQVFYAGVQALLYVLCYHLASWMVGTAASHSHPAAAVVATAGEALTAKQLAAQRQHQQQLASAASKLVKEQVWSLLSHHLQPLAVCLPSVVSEFSEQVKSLHLVDCMPLLPSAANQRSARPLEMFFPFDPYLLKRSSTALHLRDTYVRWRPARNHALIAKAAATAGGNGVAVAAVAGSLDGGSELEGGSEAEDMQEHLNESFAGDSLGESSQSDDSDDDLEEEEDGSSFPPPHSTLPAWPHGSIHSPYPQYPQNSTHTASGSRGIPPLPHNSYTRQPHGAAAAAAAAGRTGGGSRGGGRSGSSNGIIHGSSTPYGNGMVHAAAGTSVGAASRIAHSYSPSNSASMGDRTPPFGTSPMLERYVPSSAGYSHPPAGSSHGNGMGNGHSHMAMSITPDGMGGHYMNNVLPSRLGAALGARR